MILINTTRLINICPTIWQMSNGDLAINLSQKSQENNFVCQICDKKYKDTSGYGNIKQKAVLFIM